MKIEYYGHSCFRLTSENGVRIVTDPYTKVGYELPHDLNADIVTISHGHFDHNYEAAVKGSPVIVRQAGKYSGNGVEIVGADSWHDPVQGALRGKNVIYKIKSDGVTFCHFGDLGESYSKDLAEKLLGADVWLIPVGGTYTIDAAQAKEYIEKLSPKLVIPMHYRPSDGSLDVAGIDAFLSLMDKKDVIECKTGEYFLTEKDLQNEKTKILYMERKR